MEKLYILILLIISYTQIGYTQFEELKTVDKLWYRSFELEGKPIKKKVTKDFLTRTCPDALSTFNKNRNKELLGYGLATVGVGLVCLEIDNFYNSELRTGAIAGFALITGAVFLDFSYRKGYKKTVNIYDNNCRVNKPITLNVGVTKTNNVGLFIEF